MDLKNTINNTNTQKENIKTVATQIDNKLVELGGEQATDLSDVANKMSAMVTGNYKKIGRGECNIILNDFNQDRNELKIPINLDFTPKRVFLGFHPYGGNIRSEDMFTHFIELPSGRISIYQSGNGYFIYIYSCDFDASKSEIVLSFPKYTRAKVTEWIAIG